MRYDYDDELRGDAPQMNVKGNDWIPAVIVGVILTVANVWISRSADQADTTVAALAKLETQMSNLAGQLQEMKGLPYVRREEFSGLSDRVTGLERRVYPEQRHDRAGR